MKAATAPSPNRAARRRERRKADVDPESEPRAILPAAILCMRVTPGFPYKITYRHKWQGYGKRSCRRCGAPDEPKTKKRKKR